MRVIGGKHRGARLYGPKGDEVRPTSDKVREALFNIIGGGIKGASFLDLFGGTGAVTLEAVSRGAVDVVIVELRHIDLIQKNFTKLGVRTPDDARVMRADAFVAIGELKRRCSGFDYIYADPPWKEGLEGRCVAEGAGLLNPGGWLVVESFFKTEAPQAPEGLTLEQTRRYGDTSLIFYRRVTAASSGKG